MPSPPWGREGGPPPAFSSAGAGRVRGWWAGARPSPGYIAPLKALGKDHATSSTFSRNVGTALRCLWFQGIDPLTPGPTPPRGRGENVETRGLGLAPAWAVSPWRERGGPTVELGHSLTDCSRGRPGQSQTMSLVRPDAIGLGRVVNSKAAAEASGKETSSPYRNSL